MRISRVNTLYIILVWVLVILLLGIVLTIGYLSNMNDLQNLMSNEAEQLITVVSISARASIHSLDEVEEVTSKRLLNNAYMIEQIVANESLTPEELHNIVKNNDLFSVNCIDSSGVSVLRIGSDSMRMQNDIKEHQDVVTRVLNGESQKEVIGFMGRYSADQKYGVVIATRTGGAIVVNIDSEKMLDFRISIGLGTLFREIGNTESVRYAVLQDTLGIIAASTGVSDMSRITDDPFLMEHGNGVAGTRFYDGAGEPVFEIVQPLIVDDVNLGLVRIGMNVDHFNAIRIRALRQFFILFTAAAFSGAFLLIYIMLRQNYRVLNMEHDRILGEVREMEEERRRSERLTSMGRLAAGVAHEIRNPLNAISMIAQRLKAEFVPTSDRDEYARFLSVISGEIDRIKKIIESFLRYVRPPKLEKQSISLEKLATDAVAVIAEKARATGITVKVSVPYNSTCWCDPEQMKQTLLNLLLNAIDAIDVDGSIEISARHLKNTVEIRVADSGKGIPEAELPNIFDPYFTTKDHGSGLGLSEVHRIISAHGGTISAGSLSNGGAQFTIQLPVMGDRG